MKKVLAAVLVLLMAQSVNAENGKNLRKKDSEKLWSDYGDSWLCKDKNGSISSAGAVISEDGKAMRCMQSVKTGKYDWVYIY